MTEFHPVTEIFPLMQGEQYERLVQDIRENGLHESIWLHPDGRIIDGRNRHRACLDAGRVPHFETWKGKGSLIQFVVSLNLHRRHLTSSQRAAAAAVALEQLKVEAKERQREGGKTKVRQKIAEAPDAGRANEQAAKMFGTNRTYVAEAAKLKGEDPEKFEEVKRGAVGIEDYESRRLRDDFEFNHKQLAARMHKLGLGDGDRLRVAKWSRSLRSFSREDKWENQALDLYERGAGEPLKAALRHTKKVCDLDYAQKKEERERRNAEEEEREWQEREPFEFFAEFLLGNAPGLDAYDRTEDYERLVRHLKKCRIRKLTTAVEKKKAEFDAEVEEDDRRTDRVLASAD